MSNQPKYSASSLEYYTLGRGRGLFPPGQEPVCRPGRTGWGRGHSAPPTAPFPAVGAAAKEPAPIDAARRDTLPTVGGTGRGRGSWFAYKATLPSLEAQPLPVLVDKAEERVTLPKVGAVAPTAMVASTGPRFSPGPPGPLELPSRLSG